MGEFVSYPSNGGTSTGYLADPADPGAPGLILVHGNRGLVPHLVSLADRFAKAGFRVFAPDRFAGRTIARSDRSDEPASGTTLDAAAADTAAAADHLAGTGTGAIGVVGFSMGGSLALWSAAQSQRLVAAVGFYPEAPWDGMAPTWPGYQGKAALVHCAAESGTSTGAGVAAIGEAIRAAGGTCVRHDYPGTRRAFFNDDRLDVYDVDAAALAWARTLDFFRDRLR